jgi:hypothetical protein
VTRPSWERNPGAHRRESGYNLYYRALKPDKRDPKRNGGGKYRWLDLKALAENVLGASYSVEAVKYYTALVKSTYKPASLARQRMYLRALATSR